MAKYGVVGTNGAPKPAAAQVARWNDGVKRHTVFSAAGTQLNQWGLYEYISEEKKAKIASLLTDVIASTEISLPPGLLENLTDGIVLPQWAVSFDVGIARGANPNLFNWVSVSYPQAGGGGDSLLSNPETSLENTWGDINGLTFSESCAIGTKDMIAKIKATPGTFAIVGHSQGALVATQVLRSIVLPGGELYSRRNDFIGGVGTGNPCRKPGSPWPGMPNPGGGGFLSYVTNFPYVNGLNNVAVPAGKWIDLACPGDIITTVPVDQNAGLREVITLIARSIASQFTRNKIDGMGLTLVNLLFSIFGSGAAPVLVGTLLADFAGEILRLDRQTSLQQFIDYIVHVKNDYLINPHVLYGVTKPPTLPTGIPGLTSSSTYVDVGIAYLNWRGSLVRPR